jgi:acyl-CoA reductase-like NAD-dependent aldehyde dehydrogenase
MPYKTINPATDETARTFADISDAELDNALEVARSCYRSDWRHRAIADRTRIVKVAAARLRANVAEYVFINQPARTAPEIPFGGIKNSGFGRELGFGEFVNRKLINAAPAGSPPWGPVP